MVEIAQRELRTPGRPILRRAEADEHFTITTSGRPFARLGPSADTRRPGARLQPAQTTPLHEDREIQKPHISQADACSPEGRSVRLRIHQRARMELISIVAATSVYAPAPIALDPFVEDSHLVGLFVRR